MISTYYFHKHPPLLSIALFFPNKVCALSLCIEDGLPGKYNGYYFLPDCVTLALQNFMCEMVRTLIRVILKQNEGVSPHPFTLIGKFKFVLQTSQTIPLTFMGWQITIGRS